MTDGDFWPSQHSDEQTLLRLAASLVEHLRLENRHIALELTISRTPTL